MPITIGNGHGYMKLFFVRKDLRSGDVRNIMDISQFKQYSQYFGFGCLALYIGLLVWDAFLDGDDVFNVPGFKEIIAFVGAFFLGMFVSDMKNRNADGDNVRDGSETQE